MRPVSQNRDRVLVTGGAGFIGTNLVAELLNRGIEVRSIGLRAPACPAHKDVSQVCDVSNRPGLEDVFASFDPTVVFHLAAQTKLCTPCPAYDVNIQGTENVLRALPSSNVRLAVFASSMVVAWRGDRAESLTRYAESKAVLERAVIAAPGISCTRCIVRPVSTWGPWFRAPFLEFFDRIARRQYWHLGAADVPKRLGYVGNTVYQLLQLLSASREQLDLKVIYLGDYEPITIRQWAEAISRCFRVSPPRTLPDWMAGIAARIGDLLERLRIPEVPLTSRRLANMRADTSQFPIDEVRRIAGPLPYSLEAGVDRTVRWMQSLA